MERFVQAISGLDARTMILMAAVLYFSLTMVLLYTYFFRKTYPGFAALALGQLSWSCGVWLIFYRVAGEGASLVIGNGLLLLHGVFWYHGIARYGGVGNLRPRDLVNVVLAVLTEALVVYYGVFDLDTCRRVVAVSGCSCVVYGRMALEPYLVRRWKTYSMQSVLSAILLFVSCAFGVRAVQAWAAVDCPVGGPDHVVKLLLLMSMFLLSLLTFCILSMTSGRVEAELRDARDALRQQAETDALTGLSNRRHFLEQARAILDGVREQGGRASLVMLDLDHFKRINDAYGHQAGDLTLRVVADRLREALREGDVIGRLGGEEFGVLLPGLDRDQALAVARRLRQAVAASLPGGRRVTASLGVADGEFHLDGLLAKADEYLYAAKEAGRDRIAWHGGLVAQDDALEA
ncbi:GGDEF domain-containing protein [Solidesulfovibrio sp.]|uniref:GGDEF domain-containing protein n=1 Tax=Solidesulfovibrio sp. TaxID=2910990 RepID=UPI0026313B94|nr:GGDEF domain-containing protein [Solidesulfovibrio sp.]